MVKKANRTGDFRSFTIEGSSINFSGSQLVSATPGGAAKKSTTILFNLIKNEPKFARYKSDDKVQFILRETTIGSKKKTYAYDGYKEILDPPLVRKVGNSEWTQTFKTKAIALHEDDINETLKKHL